MKVRFSDAVVNRGKKNRDPLFERGNWRFDILNEGRYTGGSLTVHNMKKKDAINYVLGGPLHGCQIAVHQVQ